MGIAMIGLDRILDGTGLMGTGLDRTGLDWTGWESLDRKESWTESWTALCLYCQQPTPICVSP